MTNYRWSHNRAYEHVPKAKTAIEILMMTVIDVDDSNQLIRSVLEYRLRWTDPRLSWDPSLFMDINHIYAPTDKVWTPAIFAENIMQTEPVACHDTFPDSVIVSSNGDIVRVFTLSVLFTCTIKAGKFPFDTQSCSLDFAEYLMDPSETDLSMSVVEDAIFKGNGEWCIKNITNSMRLIDSGVEPYHTVSLNFQMQRLSPYYVTLMIIPIQVITNISVFALFWISEAGLIDQAVVTLSSLISLLVLTDIMDKSVPKTSDIPNSGSSVLCIYFPAKHIWWNITVMTLALCDIRLLTFLKKNEIKFTLPKSGTTSSFTSFQSFLEVLGALLDERIFHLLLFQALSFLSLVVFKF
ncbi:Neurotransmitter-gated ion-channel ligand binding domain protein [Ancylostoma caninum]|uniref:Neurotransmitter-gated ion-channel ligand binding domain protein n=1 Tax=Ancylostoma caninum TaxID=29170 RepID=A0A368GH94_ANCCA|nr:Neurotransmitter-gated ion-channel ligand binding domain protein [Ancylostoma caninum]